jgi:4-hydroxy-tetrahydrodipicolinate reductase
MTINIGVAGCLGRMGSELVKKIILNKKTNFSGGFEQANHKDVNKNIGDVLKCESDKKILKNGLDIFNNSDVVIDFTIPQSTKKNIDFARETKTALVIGTTGLDQAMMNLIYKASNTVAILQSTNMSLGVNVLINLVEKTAASLSASNYDIEISETHHKHKIDAPSGTALTLGEHAAKGRKENFHDIKVFDRTKNTFERKKGEIGFSVTRGGEIPGEHTVSFIGNNDRIDFQHKAYSRSIFVSGAIEAARFLVKKEPGLYTMKDMIFF